MNAKKVSILADLDEGLYRDLAEYAEANALDVQEIVCRAVDVYLATQAVSREEKENGFSKLSDALDIPEETIRKLAGYLVDYSVNKNSLLYQELGNLARFIVETQKEVGRINLTGITREDIPETSDQLEGILEATEEATDHILSATEKLLEMTDRWEAFCERIKPHVPKDEWELTPGRTPEKLLGEMREEMMKTLSACNFQDLTGQRIQKIVALIRKIEEKIMDLIVRYEQTQESDRPDSALNERRKRKENVTSGKAGSPLKGPQRKSEAFAQEDIDSLLSDLGF